MERSRLASGCLEPGKRVPGEPLNRYDLLLNSIPDPAARRRLIARFERTASTPDGVLGFRHDFVLGGASEMPWGEQP